MLCSFMQAILTAPKDLQAAVLPMCQAGPDAR